MKTMMARTTCPFCHEDFENVFRYVTHLEEVIADLWGE